GGARGDPAVRGAVVVLRGPQPGAGAQGQRLVVEERGRGGLAGLEGGGVDDWLEGAPRLALGPAGAVELALVVPPAADVGEDAAGRRVHRDQGRLERAPLAPAV